ncbi:MAG: aminoacyl-tRNA hydrolase [Patescibacteria group bacterium]
MKYFVIGLGNKGGEYKDTRHNSGAQIVEYLQLALDFPDWRENKKVKAKESNGKIGKHSVTLILPEQFMNNNGKILPAFIKSKNDASRLLVIYDELDLPIGKMKLSFARSSGGHKGLESVIRSIRTKDFMRLRVGISPESKGVAKKPKGEEAVVKFILGKFKEDELEILKKEKLKIKKVVESIVENGFERAMGEFN